MFTGNSSELQHRLETRRFENLSGEERIEKLGRIFDGGDRDSRRNPTGW
jgi:hypothetical protein